MKTKVILSQQMASAIIAAGQESEIAGRTAWFLSAEFPAPDRTNPTWLHSIKWLKMASNVWTVNNPVEMLWVIENGFDFITTDRPDLFLRLVR